jgi:hypothetical protein
MSHRLSVRIEMKRDDWQAILQGTAIGLREDDVRTLMAPTRAALGTPSLPEVWVERTWLETVMYGTGVYTRKQLVSGNHGWDSGFDKSSRCQPSHIQHQINLLRAGYQAYFVRPVTTGTGTSCSRTQSAPMESPKPKIWRR